MGKAQPAAETGHDFGHAIEISRRRVLHELILMANQSKQA